jgi:hypothetical protein
MIHSLTNILEAEFGSKSCRSKISQDMKIMNKYCQEMFLYSVTQAGLKVFVVGVIRIIIQIDGFLTNS